MHTVDVIFEFGLGLALVGLATRFRRFWQVFPLALLGAMLVYHGALRSGYLEGSLVWIFGVVGGGLIIFGIAGRHMRFAETAGLVGAALLLLSAMMFFERNVGVDQIVLAAVALAALIACALLHRWPLAPVLAILSLFGMGFAFAMGGLVEVDIWLSSLFFRWSLDTGIPEQVWIIALQGVWLAALLGLALLGPQVLAVRLALYLLIAIGLFAYVDNWSWMINDATLGEAQPGWLTELDYSTGRELFYDLFVALFTAVSLIIARTRLFDLSAGQRGGTVHDVFISYKREDRSRVEAIAAALRANGLTVWFDTRLASGKSFDAEINHQVRNARAVLVCWSKAATGSEWVRAEASIGRERGVLTACILEPCELFPPFNLVHAEDLTRGKPDATNPAWLKLLAQLGELARKPAAAEPVTA